MVSRYTPGVTRCILIVLLCNWLYAGAQNNGIGVTLVNYTVDSGNSINEGYTITINANVTNFDTTAFSGVINFGLSNSHEVLTNDGIFAGPPYTGDQIKLGGGETVPAIFSVNVNQQYFAPGPDVVVVWPICNQPIADSIIININVVDPSGINAVANKLFTYAVLSDKILLQNLNVNFQQVRIYDILGQELYQLKGDYISQVPLSLLPKGIYVCQLTTSEGKKNIIKFFH